MIHYFLFQMESPVTVYAAIVGLAVVAAVKVSSTPTSHFYHRPATMAAFHQTRKQRARANCPGLLITCLTYHLGFFPYALANYGWMFARKYLPVTLRVVDSLSISL